MSHYKFISFQEKERTIKSAEANLAGFFSRDINSNCEQKSVPIHTVPIEEEYLLAAEKECKHFDYLMIEYEKTSEYQRLFMDHEPLITHLEKTLNISFRTITDLVNLYDALLIERIKGYRYDLNEKILFVIIINMLNFSQEFH